MFMSYYMILLCQLIYLYMYLVLHGLYYLCMGLYVFVTFMGSLLVLLLFILLPL